LEHVRDLPFSPEAPREARRVVDECIGHDVKPEIRAAVLTVTSELVTHAVQCAEPPLRIECLKVGGSVSVLVSHAGRSTPLTGYGRDALLGMAQAAGVRLASGRLGFQLSL
jgi:hypothetical protein